MALSRPQWILALVAVCGLGFAAGLLAHSGLSKPEPAAETTFAEGEVGKVERISGDFKAPGVPALAVEKQAPNVATAATAATDTTPSAAPATAAPTTPPATSTSDGPTFTTGN